MLLLERVTKAYELAGVGRRTVLRDVTAVFRPGDAVGILGRNGAGKSTLLRLLAGVEHPNSGRVVRRMMTSWPLAHGVGLQPALSGDDNARFVARIYGRPVQDVLDFVEDFTELGNYMSAPVRTYSAGMVSRLLLGLSLAVDFDCYLIDEITAVGDARFVERAQAMLQQRLAGRAVIMVSHFPEHLKMFCRTGAILHGGALTFFEDLDEAIATYKAL